jgi:Phosphorylase superfamily
LFNAWRSEARADLARLLPYEEKRSKLWTSDLVRADVEILASGHEACGPVVGAAAAFSRWIRSFNRNIKGLDMESAAVLKVARAREPAVAALVIRGISDYGDDRKEQLDLIGGGALRRYAMRNTVRFLWALLDAGALPHANPR